MSEGVKVDFDSMGAPSQQMFIDNAGIYRGMVVKKFGIAPIVEKDGKKKGGQLEITMESDKDGVFIARIFPLPKTEEEVKWKGKVYNDKGDEVRDKTAQEQMQDDYRDFAYFLIQLGMALKQPFDNVKRIVATESTFEGMIASFAKAFLSVLPTKEKIDVKILWSNSDKNKSSFLQLPKASQRSVVFTAYNPTSEKSDLVISAWEKKNCMIEKYPQRKSSGDAKLGTASQESAAAKIAASAGLGPVAGGKPNDLF